MIQVLIFTLQTCAPCAVYKESIKDEYFGDDVEVRLYDMTDPIGEVVDLSVKYNVRGAPTTVVLDNNGQVYYIGTMIKDADKLRKTIDEARNR